MRMRFRLPELLDARGWSPYALSKETDGRISMSTAYRLVKLKGRVKTFDAALCEELCAVLNVSPAELFEMEGTTSARSATKRAAAVRRPAARKTARAAAKHARR